MFNCAIAFASSVWMAFAGDVVSDIELTGTLDIDVPAGETWEYSGALSGSGSILKYGGGKLVLAKENTFSGGVTITNGTIEVAEQAALGSGLLSINNPSSKPKVSVKFSKKDAVVSNAIKLPNSSSNASDDNPHVHVMENTTFTGNITSYANTFYMGNKSHNKNSIESAYPTNTIEGDLWTYTSRSLSVTTHGVTVLKGNVQVGGAVYVGTQSSSTGFLVLDTESCNVKTFHLWSGSLYCKRRNVLNGAKLDIRQNDASPNSHIDLGGFDQTCATLDKYSTGTSFPTTGNGFSIDSPAGPATLTVTGGAANASCNCYFAINDQITLHLDADPTFTCNFKKRANGTSGDIIVSKGLFSVTDTATFKAVKRINVAQNGQFILSSTETEALLGMRDLEVSGVFRSTANAPFSAEEVRLVINEGATFDIGAALKVASFRIRGEDLDGGTYTHSDYSEIAEGTTSLFLLRSSQKHGLAVAVISLYPPRQTGVEKQLQT
jgi:autotransporter-associated beta strand protein